MLIFFTSFLVSFTNAYDNRLHASILLLSTTKNTIEYRYLGRRSIGFVMTQLTSFIRTSMSVNPNTAASAVATQHNVETEVAPNEGVSSSFKRLWLINMVE